MQDRLKYRVWDKINEVWIENSLLDTKQGCIAGFYMPEKAMKRRIVVEQCTGLKDKNGKLIYEGDIVKTEWFDEKTIYQVVWDEKMACFYFDSKDMFYLFDDLPAEVTEIIGNIDENPDLLGSEER